MFFFSFLYSGVPDSTKSRALHALVSYVYRTLRALTLTCHVYLLWFLTFLVSYVFSCPTCLTCYCTSRVLCLACSRAVRVSNSMCSCAPRLSLASGVSSLTCSYASHVFQLLELVSLVLLVLQLSEFFSFLAKVNHCDRQQQIYT